MSSTWMRKVVGAHRGLPFWVGQSLSAVVMLVCIAWIAVAFAVIGPSGHEGLTAFVTANVVRVPATLAILAVAWHAWLGARSVLMDYVPWMGLRMLKYVGTICYLVLCTIWLVGIMWGAR